MSELSELAEQIRSQAAISDRPGQHAKLMAIAKQVAELERSHKRAVEQARAEQVRPLMPAEHMVYTVARNQIRRGDNPPLNTTAGLLLTIERLAGIEQAADEPSRQETGT